MKERVCVRIAEIDNATEDVRKSDGWEKCIKSNRWFKVEIDTYGGLVRDLLKKTSIHMLATSSKTWSAGRSPNLSIIKGIAPTFVSSFCCSHKFGNARRAVDIGIDGTTFCGIRNALPVAQIVQRINPTNVIPLEIVVHRFLFILAISPSSSEFLQLISPNGM